MKKILCVICMLVMCFVCGASVRADQVYSYTVRGIVRALPGNGRAPNEILIKHEPIPDYRDEAGNVVGMMAMTMPFYLAQPSSAQGLAVGDRVELRVEQRLKPTFSENVVSIAKIP